MSIPVDRGWQNSRLKIEAGKTYRITASGRYQVGKSAKPWISEPGGVSIHYVHGKPLGELLAAVRPERVSTGESLFAAPLRVGLGTTLKPEKSGTLYFRTNISSGELDRAAGSVSVEVVEQ